MVTEKINKLYELAIKEKDYPLQVLLHWFIEEQVEEEANAGEIVEQLRMIGDKSSSVFYIDKKMAKR